MGALNCGGGLIIPDCLSWLCAFGILDALLGIADDLRGSVEPRSSDGREALDRRRCCCFG